MVGAVEQAAFGQALHRYVAALCRGDACHVVLQRVLTLADHRHVVRGARGLQHVDGEVGDGLLHREHRVGGVEFRTEQPALFRRPRREDDRALRRRLALHDAGDVENASDADAVVIGARAVDAALCVGSAFAIGVPVGAEHHHFVLAGGAGDLGQHVVAHDFLVVHRNLGIERHALEFHRLKVRTARSDRQLGKVQPGRGE